ncbi:hypothetical protein D3C85_827990 [compost metagenome]
MDHDQQTCATVGQQEMNELHQRSFQRQRTLDAVRFAQEDVGRRGVTGVDDDAAQAFSRFHVGGREVMRAPAMVAVAHEAQTQGVVSRVQRGQYRIDQRRIEFAADVEQDRLVEVMRVRATVIEQFELHRMQQLRAIGWTGVRFRVLDNFDQARHRRDGRFGVKILDRELQAFAAQMGAELEQQDGIGTERKEILVD